MPGAITPPQIVALVVDHVEGGGGAEIDDDQRRPGRSDAPPTALARRSAPTSCGLSISTLMPSSTSGLADDQRLAVEIALAERRRLNSACGTTLAMIASVIDLRLEPCQRHQLGQPDRILVGRAAGLGARCASRRRCRSPSNTANLTLVLLALMASSMAVLLRPRGRRNVAGGDLARPPSAVSSSSAPSRSRPAKRPREQSRRSSRTSTRPPSPAAWPSQRRAHRREALAAPRR